MVMDFRVFRQSNQLNANAILTSGGTSVKAFVVLRFRYAAISNGFAIRIIFVAGSAGQSFVAGWL